ncbi:MAG: hypothetical protein JWQ96_1459 [Segetibacter sp.]|nr:hypothetical protein [Segetibacter sp.]
MRVEKNKEYSFDEKQYLFKYLDLHKLLYFLNTRNLFFSPLAYFDDPLEGISEQFMNENAKVNAARNTDDTPDPSEQNELLNSYKKYFDKVQRTLFASCWFLGTRESLAMWESYSNNDSVALRFNSEELTNLMKDRFLKIEEKDFSTMAYGKVEYVNLSPFDPNDTELKNCGHRFKGFIKDLSYKHEEEFRFLLMQKEDKEQYNYFDVSIGDLQNINFTIITHPYMENWKYKNIEMFLQNLGLEDKLKRSEIPTRKRIFDLP